MSGYAGQSFIELREPTYQPGLLVITVNSRGIHNSPGYQWRSDRAERPGCFFELQETGAGGSIYRN
jgi:hypothetical protein